MASIFGGLLGLGPGIYLFGLLVRRYGGSTPVKAMAVGAVVVAFAVGSIALAWLTLRLEKKPPVTGGSIRP